MKKVGIISQARMASTRLPGKIMLSIQGKPLLWYFNERLKTSGVPLYLATSTNPNNDIIEAFGKEHGIFVFRGEEDDVLKRYYDCAKKNEIETIIRITSDCPLIDGEMIKKALAQYDAWNDDRIHFSNCVERTYPHGLNFEIFSFNLLEDAHLHATEPFHREHVTPYIIQNVSGNVMLKHFTRDGDASHIRVTVDTYQDFLLIEKLIAEYGADTMSTEEIVALFESHPELAGINQSVAAHAWGDGKK